MLGLFYVKMLDCSNLISVVRKINASKMYSQRKLTFDLRLSHGGFKLRNQETTNLYGSKLPKDKRLYLRLFGNGKPIVDSPIIAVKGSIKRRSIFKDINV